MFTDRNVLRMITPEDVFVSKVNCVFIFDCSLESS